MLGLGLSILLVAFCCGEVSPPVREAALPPGLLLGRMRIAERGVISLGLSIVCAVLEAEAMPLTFCLPNSPGVPWVPGTGVGVATLGAGSCGKFPYGVAALGIVVPGVPSGDKPDPRRDGVAGFVASPGVDSPPPNVEAEAENRDALDWKPAAFGAKLKLEVVAPKGDRPPRAG